MKTTIKVHEALELDAMKEMRKIYKSKKLSDEDKYLKIHNMFTGIMRWLDEAGIK